MNLRADQLLLCEIQGKIFERSGIVGYDSESFIKFFMNSDVTHHLDQIYDHFQWAGEAYIFSSLIEEASKSNVLLKGKVFLSESLYWIGFIYRFWHYYKCKESKDIFKISDANTMDRCWLGYHTLSPEMVVDRLEEAYLIKNL